MAILIIGILFVVVGLGAVIFLFKSDSAGSRHQSFQKLNLENASDPANNNQPDVPMPATKEAIAWEKRNELGLVKAWWSTIKHVITKPGEFFDQSEVRESFLNPYLFQLSILVLVAICTFIFQIFFSPGEAVKNFAMSLLFTFVGIYIAAAFMHIFVLIVGGKGGYRGTFHVYAYATAANLFSIIPFLGPFISMVWSIVVIFKGIKRVHQLSTVRTVLATGGPVFIALIALLAAIAIPNFMRANISANDALAQSTLRSLSTAAETYAVANRRYPSSIYDLTDANPPYIGRPYCDTEESGYTYRCAFDPRGYKFQATPVEEGVTGTAVMTITTEGNLQ